MRAGRKPRVDDRSSRLAEGGDQGRDRPDDRAACAPPVGLPCARSRSACRPRAAPLAAVSSANGSSCAGITQQLGVELDRPDSAERLRHRAAVLGGLGLPLELVRVDTRHPRTRAQKDVGDGEAVADLVELDRGLGLDALGLVARLTESRRQRHREAARVSGGYQLLRIRAVALLESRLKRVRALVGPLAIRMVPPTPLGVSPTRACRSPWHVLSSFVASGSGSLRSDAPRRLRPVRGARDGAASLYVAAGTGVAQPTDAARVRSAGEASPASSFSSAASAARARRRRAGRAPPRGHACGPPAPPLPRAGPRASGRPPPSSPSSPAARLTSPAAARRSTRRTAAECVSPSGLRIVSIDEPSRKVSSAASAAGPDPPCAAAALAATSRRSATANDSAPRRLASRAPSNA